MRFPPAARCVAKRGSCLAVSMFIFQTAWPLQQGDTPPAVAACHGGHEIYSFGPYLTRHQPTPYTQSKSRLTCFSSGSVGGSWRPGSG